MKNLVSILALAVVMSLAGCKSSQVSTGGGSSSGGNTGTGKPQDNSVQAVFARELPQFRVNPEETDDLESFEHIRREDPRLQVKPAGPVQSTYTLDTKLEYKLSQIKTARQSVEKVMGYRILLYSGTDVAHANTLVKSIEDAFSDYDIKEAEGSLVTPEATISIKDVRPTEIHFDYVAPNYIVKIGNYISRMEAHHVFIKLKEAFPNAIVISEPVDLQRAE